MITYPVLLILTLFNVLLVSGEVRNYYEGILHEKNSNIFHAMAYLLTNEIFLNFSINTKKNESQRKRNLHRGKRYRKSSKGKKVKYVKSESCAESPSPSPIIDLVGKQLVHTWDEINLSVITLFCNASEFVWNEASDPNAIFAGRENYVRTVVSDEVVQFSWKESPVARNLGLTYTLNFRTGKIYGVIVNASPSTNLNLSGNFTIVDGLEVAFPLLSC